jgi:GTP-binding protein
MYEWLLHYDKPIFIVATKVDKLRQREFKVFIDRLAETYTQAKVIPFSSVKGSGREQIWKQIMGILGQREEDVDER